MAQFSDVSSTYGAPMGRHEYGIAENCEPNSITVFKVSLDSGGYDDGGAYWGIPDNLYCAKDDDDRYVHFIRANSVKQAIEKLQIDAEYLAEIDYAALLIDGGSSPVIESAFNSYVETALDDGWDDGEEGLVDRNSYNRADIHPETVEELRKIATGFLGRIAAEGLLSQALEYEDLEHIMYDFWMTQNGAGVGFWDGDYGNELGERLSVIAVEFGAIDLYVGDDGKIYC